MRQQGNTSAGTGTGRTGVPPARVRPAPELPIRPQVALREVAGNGRWAGIRRRAWAPGASRASWGLGRTAAETPNPQSFVTFPWSDSSNGSFTVEGPEAGIYNAARGPDPR